MIIFSSIVLKKLFETVRITTAVMVKSVIDIRIKYKNVYFIIPIASIISRYVYCIVYTMYMHIDYIIATFKFVVHSRGNVLTEYRYLLRKR